MIVNIDNLQILIKTNSGEEYQDILTDKCTISEQTYEINNRMNPMKSIKPLKPNKTV